MNDKFQLTQDGWCHLVSRGEHPWSSADGKKKLVQVIDDESIRAMEEHFKPEMLMDYDHESHDPEKRTTAAGWITEVTARGDGLWGKVRWSAQGREDVCGGNYRFVSPTFDLNDCEVVGNRGGMRMVRPMRLSDAAVTNRPNLAGMVPLTNRSQKDLKIVANKIQPKEISMIDMDIVLKSLLPLLGFPAETSPEDLTTEQLLEALGKLPKPQDEEKLREKVSSLEQEVVNRILDENGVQGEVRGAWRDILLANREQGVRALALTRNAAQGGRFSPTPLHNRGAAGVPTGSFHSSGRLKRQQEAIADYQKNNGCAYRDAFNAVQKTNPELFMEVC